MPKGRRSALGALIPLLRVQGTRFMAVLLIIYLTFFLVRLWFQEDGTLLMNAWFPFDVSPSPISQLIITLQILGNKYFTGAFTLHLGIYFTLIIIPCIQLDELRISLLHLNQGQDSEQQLKRCIRHHQIILAYIHQFEEVFNELLLSHLLLIIGSVCFTIITVVMNDGDVGIVSALICTVFVLIMLFCYCWFGEQLTVKTERISEAIWKCDWIGTPISFQRNAMFIIAAPNKGFTLTAGKFVSVSNKTMVTVLQQTISYLMFLLNLRR